MKALSITIIFFSILNLSSCGKEKSQSNHVNTTNHNLQPNNWNNTNSNFIAPPLINWSNNYWQNNAQNFHQSCSSFSQNYFNNATPTQYYDPNYGGLGVNFYSGYNTHVYQYNNLYYYLDQNGYCNNYPQTTYINGPITPTIPNNNSQNNCGGYDSAFTGLSLSKSFHVHNGAQSHIDIPNLNASAQEYFLTYKGLYSGVSQNDEILYVERSDGQNRTRIKDLDNTVNTGSSANTLARSCYVSIPFCLSSSQNRIHIHSISGTHSSQMTGYSITKLRPTGLTTCN